MDDVVQMTGACFDVETLSPSAADALVRWLEFGRREQPRRSAQFRFGPMDLKIQRGALLILSHSSPLLNHKLFACIDGRNRAAAGSLVVNGVVSSAAKIRAALSERDSVADALMAGLRMPDGDADEAQRRIESAFLFAGMLDLAYVRIKDIAEIDRARIAMTACLLRDADLYLLDEMALMFDTGMREKIHTRAQLLAASGKTVVLATSSPEWLQDPSFPATELNLSFAQDPLRAAARRAAAR
ncbi:hypothetical protein [Rhodopseudomonas telluris]|uniref:ABC transporter domain-containing protein n=1 Tax=Rhodopseudomonas telluris TaxID=644215 RepID=A0ABV6EN89_9BRAD